MSDIDRQFRKAQNEYDNMEHPSYYEDDFEPENIIVARQINYHIANKDHYKNGDGKLIVKKGELYRYYYERGYFLDEKEEAFDNYTTIQKTPFSKMQDVHKKRALEIHLNYKEI